MFLFNLLLFCIFCWILYKIIKFYKKSDQKIAFQNKIVWITGASSGLGRSLAIDFFKLGARVILSARREEELRKTQEECVEGLSEDDKDYCAPFVLPIDLNDTKDITSKVKEVEKRYSRIDILINCAGQGTRTSFIESTLEVHQKVMNVNYFGPLELTHNVVKLMTKQESGSIIFISSVQGFMGINDRSPYSASKHALIGLADTLTIECKKLHIMDVCPGYIKTNHSINSLVGDGNRYGENDKTTEKGYECEYVSQTIIDGICNHENELIICDFKTRLMIYIRILLPDLYFLIMRIRSSLSH